MNNYRQMAAAADTLDLADIQGNILRGYRKSNVRHLVAEVAERGYAQSWLREISGGRAVAVQRITTAEDWGGQAPEVCFNIGVTSVGMSALGVPATSVASFPQAYRDGAVARASKIGDWGKSAPAYWQDCYRDAASVHLVISMHANDSSLLDRFERDLLGGLASRALRIKGRNDGATFDGDTVHFGYRDNISQPRFKEIGGQQNWDDQPAAPLGTVLLGYPTALQQLQWSLPKPPELGFNGAFNAFRVLEQDVVAFEAFLDDAAHRLLDSALCAELLPARWSNHQPGAPECFAAMREVVAAKLMGRWRNGVPLALSPRDPDPYPKVSDSAFDYRDDDIGAGCPLGSHTRRANPRNSKIVQRLANHTRRLVRRGLPFGPRFDPDKPDTEKRGLLGNFICADLAAQFEAVQYDWINLGLQDPRITGSNDPVLGANQADASWFDIISAAGETVRLHGIPRFIQTRGSAYTFFPSMSALRWIAALGSS